MLCNPMSAHGAGSNAFFATGRRHCAARFRIRSIEQVRLFNKCQVVWYVRWRRDRPHIFPCISLYFPPTAESLADVRLKVSSSNIIGLPVYRFHRILSIEFLFFSGSQTPHTKYYIITQVHAFNGGLKSFFFNGQTILWLAWSGPNM